MPAYEWNERDSPMWALLVEVANRIKDIDFESMEPRKAVIPAENVIILSSARDRDYMEDNLNLPKPAVWIFPIEEQVPLNDGTEANDMITYRVVAMIVDSAPQNNAYGLRTWLKWQDQISRALRWRMFTDLRVAGSFEFSNVRVRTIESLENVALDTKRLLRSGVAIDAPCQVVRSEDVI